MHTQYVANWCNLSGIISDYITTQRVLIEFFYIKKNEEKIPLKLVIFDPVDKAFLAFSILTLSNKIW